jgi:hypothetical protein
MDPDTVRVVNGDVPVVTKVLKPVFLSPDLSFIVEPLSAARTPLGS